MRLGGFSKDILRVAGGTAISNVVMLLALPFMSRIYSPSEFGIFAIYAGTLGVGVVLGGGRFELAIPVPKSDFDAWQLLRLSTILCVAVAAFLLVVLAFWTPSAFDELGLIIYLLPFHLVLGTYNLGLGYWLSRKGEFSWLSFSRVTFAMVTVGVQGIVGLSGGGARGLIIGSFAGALALAGLGTLRSLQRRPFAPSNGTGLLHLAGVYSRFPKYLLTAHAVNSLGSFAPVVFISAVYGQSIAGHFSMANRILIFPLQLIGNAVQQVFYAEAARRYASRGECFLLFSKTVKGLLLLGIPGLLCLSAFAPSFVTLAMGNDWEHAGFMVQVLAPFFIVRLAASPVSGLFMIAEKQDLDLAWQLAMILLVIAGLSVGILTKSWKISILGYGVAIFVSFSVNMYCSRRFAIGAANPRPDSH